MSSVLINYASLVVISITGTSIVCLGILDTLHSSLSFFTKAIILFIVCDGVYMASCYLQEHQYINAVQAWAIGDGLVIGILIAFALFMYKRNVI